MMPTRVYFVIHANTVQVPTENQWQALLNAAKTKPMASAIILAARAAQNYISARKRNLGNTDPMRYTLCGFEIEEQHRDDLLAILDTQATARSVTGTAREKFEGVLQAELREAATELGYGAQANNLSVTLINAAIANTFDRAIAIAQVQAYLANNADVWGVTLSL